MDSEHNCPGCGRRLWLMSTTNEWRLYCKSCDVRYNEHLEPMPN